MQNLRFSLIIASFIFSMQIGSSQHFLSTNGRAIVNENQDSILLRGMGLGGWMVQEGYMLQTAGFANPQHEIRATIQDLIGEEDTDLFYEAWLDNHVRKADIDSLKSWGFNSVRLPMHYNLFTLPIEEEPIIGEDTWLDRGFELTDNLISWCKANEMYVILDMHATPGGQGFDSGISDYDPTKPSLWESAENRRKLTALWGRLAERYADEQWVAGYDLINEPNWDLPGGNLLRTTYQTIIQRIRQVDTRHIIFIEGNWFANDFTGLTPPFDDNMVYSPHKYWSINDVASIQGFLDLRTQHNVPLYLGESGENSNVWFRDAIRLLEDHDIGWAWWPMKKVESVAGPLSITKTDEYQALLDFWSGNGPEPSVEVAKNTMMELAENLKIENCFYQKDVIDAMFRQVNSDATIPFADNRIPGVIHATNYDMGRIGFAYDDMDNANYQVSTGEFTAWNSGWAYRNDGVDIEASNNPINSNGFNVGFTFNGEWMQYEVDVEESGVYDILLRTASGGSGGLLHFSMDGADLTNRVFAGPTGGWQNWNSIMIEDVLLDVEDNKLRFHTDVAGFNIASFEFIKSDAESADLFPFFVGGETVNRSQIKVSINKPMDSNLGSAPSGFEVFINDTQVAITDVFVDTDNSRLINIGVDYVMNSTDEIEVSYVDSDVKDTDGNNLAEFTLEDVRNTLEFSHSIPGKIEAEDFATQMGVQLETTTDNGGGQNIGFLDFNDFLDYRVIINQAGNYRLDYRTASQFATGSLQLFLIDDNGASTLIDTPVFASTGGWQTWTTTSSTVALPEGSYTMRVVINQSPFNINWFDFSFSTSVNDHEAFVEYPSVSPNPTSDVLNVSARLFDQQNVRLDIFSMEGKFLSGKSLNNALQFSETLTVQHLPEGMYLLKITTESGQSYNHRFVKM